MGIIKNAVACAYCSKLSPGPKGKICGILQETVQINDVKYLIVGIGLNLVKSPNIKNYPTTNLYELTKTKISASKMSKELLFIYKNFLKSQKVF